MSRFVHQWRAFQEVETSRALLRTVVENSPYAIAMLDRDLRYLFASERWLRDFNLPLRLDELRGRSHYEVFPEISDRWREIHRRGLAGETARSDAEAFVRADGSVDWIRWEIHPWYDARGAVGGIVIYSEDISLEKRAGDELLRWKEIFDNASWGMSLAMPDNHFVVVNRAFADMHGTTPDHWIGRSLLDMFTEESKAMLPELARRANEQGHIVYESMHVRADGSTFPVLTEVTAFKDASGRVRYRAANFQDITERKRIEHELEQERDRLRVAVAARDEFLAVAAHELRTPLTTLALQLDAVRRADQRPGAERQPGPDEREQLHRRLDIFGRQVARLTTLVESLLDVSRLGITQLALDRDDVDLTALAADIVAQYADQAARTGGAITLDAPGPVVAACDAQRMSQVISHLLSNAVKYGAGRPVRVELRRGDGEVTLAVRDEGIGVAPGDQTRIFGRFERAVSSNQYGGLGLGLFIAEQIVRAHGGTIQLTSAPGQGATFLVRLPTWPGGALARASHSF